MVTSAILWWVVIQIVGWAALPLAHRLFRHLPDRGYVLAKPLGLLLVSYLFWLLCVLGVLRNTTGSIIFCLVVVAGASAYLYHRAGQADGYALRAFLRERWRLILVSELLFLAGFALWALYRAYNPDISATEKPMEFAFLNGILRSDRFPPLDPWLSGYAISYYYFGYVMMAVLTRLSGAAPSIAFNLGIALLFALTLTGAFSLVYNLVAGFRARPRGRGRRERAAAAARGRRAGPGAAGGLGGGHRRQPGGLLRGAAHPGARPARVLELAGHQDPDRSAHERPVDPRRQLVVVARLPRHPRPRFPGAQRRGDRRVPVLQLPAGGYAPPRPGAAVRLAGPGPGPQPA